MLMKPPLGIQLNRGHPLAHGLVGCWLMNERAGDNVYDLSGNGNTGSVVNAKWDADKFGSCLSFDGSGDYVEIADDSSLDLDEDFAISVWFKAADQLRSDIVYKGDTGAGGKRYMIVLRDGGQVKIEIDDDSDSKNVQTSASYDDDVWHHAVAVRDGANLRLYVDGVEVPESPTDITGYTSLANSNPLVFGIQSVGLATDPFKGLIGNVGIYKRALTPAEIASLTTDPFQMFRHRPIELWTAATSGAAPATGYMTLNTGYWG